MTEWPSVPVRTGWQVSREHPGARLTCRPRRLATRVRIPLRVFMVGGARLAERPVVVREVAGSNPVTHPQARGRNDMINSGIRQMDLSVLLDARHGPAEIDEMLSKVEHDRYVFEIIADQQDGRVVAVVMPAEERLRAVG